MAKRIHEIVMATAPSLSPKTWYGMPAWANKDGKVVCYFQDAAKFKSRYATFGFSDLANIDAGADVADVVRADGADRGRREEDRLAREEGGRLSDFGRRRADGTVTRSCDPQEVA